ncbi:Aldo-keto reductase str7, variant 2 [Marasmius oreades]|uniref:Aldo-keto reductase str7, variant 2 n=1 Tax=Marasmius oreades TaxID=181124 RepID=A0A9P7UJS4_9AGAR|nr:Aldo-keto reductase str7, variant 2 [Marasmius oreades]KAG7085847.1 Aldo-keto reductase str7, variant 2 [Marasmius oreades]
MKQVLDAALAAGCNHWDSADIYGDSEELIGKWFKRTGKRDEIFLASKFGYTPNFSGVRGDPEFVKGQCAKSLERLGVDFIDLYYVHRTDARTPIELTIGAMTEFVKEGKVKHLGLSECTAADLRRAHAIHPISAIQMEYSPLFLDIESEELNILKTARELGVTVVAYGPLGRGLITGQFRSPEDFDPDDTRRTIPKFQAENFPKILELVDRIREVGANHNDATPSQVSLAWILAQGDDFLVIPGTKKVEYLKENMGAAEIKLNPEEIALIRKYSEACVIPGDRYETVYMQYVFQQSPPLRE